MCRLDTRKKQNELISICVSIASTSWRNRPLSSRFLADAVGGGVQHVALASNDICATVDRLVAHGVELLPIPENYYDDLEARADLDETAIDRLRARNILYDRDGGGEFFQVYTKPMLEGGFFFELVERRGYKGFGAVNAPFRLAAQTRLTASPGMPNV